MHALSDGGLTYTTYMHVHPSPGVRMFRFSLSFPLADSHRFSLSLSLSPFVPLPRSFYLQCFLLRSFPSNVHLSRVSDEELIAPESLALLLANGRTDGRDVGRSSLFVRTWLPVSARQECVCVCAYALRALARVYRARDMHTCTVAPDPETRVSGRDPEESLWVDRFRKICSRVKDVGSSRAIRS